MLFERLDLVNIRSHTDSTVRFPTGLVLLAGDIGSGKSSILQGVEFALFGIRRGELSGESLLRHGEREGSVTLSLRVAGSSVRVHRELKRTKDSVRQDTGWLEVDGSREELTARELKARVLDLLGYPPELLTKHKGFVYRYTVYTPQEEMKQILYERSESRLDVLRSVFGVDKYKRVAENAATLKKSLRDKQRFLEGQVSDLPDLVDSLEELREDKQSLTEELEGLEASEREAKKRLVAARKEGEELEAAARKDQERRERLQAAQARVKELKKQQESLQVREERLSVVAGQEFEEVADPAPARKKLRLLREKNQSVVAAARADEKRLSAEVTRLQEELEGVVSLEVCPQCRQPVEEGHKHSLREAASERVEELEEELLVVRERLSRAKSNLSKLADKEELLDAREQSFKNLVSRKQERVRAREQLAELAQEREEVSSSLTKQLSVVTSLTESSFDRSAYTRFQERLEELRSQHSEARVSSQRVRSRLEAVSERLEAVSERVSSRREQKRLLALLASREQWLDGLFLQAVAEVERLVLRSLHQEFSAKFTQWFMQLLEEDSLYAELDASFAPVLTQDGYDVDLSSLSGGEKQSVALAYRLALNTVVSSLLGARSADVLVLDEPTDGFSDAQLDRVRDVLSEVGCEQVLLVSHEQKMQSFVDCVVRVVKRAGVSQVVTE